MTESSVVQLARFNSTDVASNTEWTTALKQPIVMNEGDSAVVSKAYLDTRLNGGGDIIIAEDTLLKLTFYFYMLFPPDGTSLSLQGGVPPVDIPADSPATYPATQSPPASGTRQNPSALNLFVSNFQEGPNYYTDASGVHLMKGTWTQYQTGTAIAGAALTNAPPYLNNGVPIPVWQDTAVGNSQPTAIEVPLLLVTIPTDSADVNTSIPFTKVWEYLLPQGSYSPDQLAEIITREMSQIQRSGLVQPSYTAFEQFGTSTPTTLNSFLAKGQMIDIIDAPNIAQSYTLIEPYVLAPVPDYDGSTATQWANGMVYSTNNPDSGFGSQQNCILSTFVPDAIIPNIYLFDSPLSDNSPSVNPTIFQQLSFQAGWACGKTVGANSEAIVLRDYTSPIIGCASPELAFNDQAGVFQFVYTHTPLLELPTGGGAAGTNTSDAPIEVVKIIKTINGDFTNTPTIPNTFFQNAQVNICEHTKHSGVIFKEMLPRNFWNGILGFDTDKLCIPQADIWGTAATMTYKKFTEITTAGYVGLENNFNLQNVSPTTNNLNQPPYLGPVPIYPIKSSLAGELTYTNLMNSARWFGEDYILRNNGLWWSTPPPPVPNPDPVPPAVFHPPYSTYFPLTTFFPFFYEEYSSALTATKPISAVSAPLSNVSNVGHFLIEIVAYGNDTELITNETVYQVKSILSSYYNSQGSFQTSPFPDSYVYTHTGETQIIHSFKVRIIDPFTMDTATNIGPSSSVYIQFNKALNKISLMQPV
jgi:hypothetical protein